MQFPYLDSADGLRAARPAARRPGWRVPRVRGDAAGSRSTFGRVLEGPATIQYPEEKTPVYPRFRGRHKLHRFEDTGLGEVRRVLAVRSGLSGRLHPRGRGGEHTDNRASPGERYAEVYEINLSRCIFCGYCEVACPFDAITMGHEYEISDYNRSDLIFTKEALLAEPIEKAPLRTEGE